MKRAVLFSLLLAGSAVAGNQPAPTAADLAVPPITGQWGGQVQFVMSGADGKVFTDMSLVQLMITIRPDLKVTGIAPKIGCRFTGMATPQPSQRAEASMSIELAAEHCLNAIFNQESYTGVAKLPNGAPVFNLSLKSTAKNGNTFEIFGPMRRTK